MKRFAAIVIFAVLVPAAAASGAVHNGQITFNPPANPPSIGSGTLPVDEQNVYLQSVALSYDDVAGSLTISVVEFEPGWWGSVFDDLQMRLADKCLTGLETAADELDIDIPSNSNDIPTGPQNPDVIAFEQQYPGEPYPFAEAAPTATATLAGHVGQVSGAGTFDGTTFTFTLSDPGFTQEDWRCATLSQGGNPAIELDGWPAATRITAKRATASQVRELTAVANAHHTIGFSSALQYLSPVRVTSNGWAYGQIDARNPKDQGNAGIFFRLANGRWRVAAAGSDFPSVPAAVQRAVGV
jgi:hypothetical protein